MLCLVFLQLYTILFMSFSFVCLWVGCKSRSSGLSLHPYTQVSIKGLDQFFFGCLCFVCLFSMLLCLDPCLYAQIQVFAMFLFVFPLWVRVFAPLMPLCLFGCILSPLWLVWMQPHVRVHLRDVRLSFSLLFSFARQGFSCQPCMCLITCLALPFV